MMHFLEIPYLGTAEEDVLLSTWFVGEEQPFAKGEVLAAVETLKASFEVEAQEDGMLLRQLVLEGQRVPVCAPMGVVGRAGETASREEVDRWVEAEQRRRTDSTGSPTVEPLPAIDAAGAVPAAASPTADVDGQLESEFVEMVRRDLDAFAALSSELKLYLYRRAGGRIGRDVHLGPGTALDVERLVLGDRCRFGEGCVVEAIEFVAGGLAQLGPRCTVRSRRVRLGDNAFFAADVDVGGGGAMDPRAELIVGSHGFVGEHVHLNPCRRIELGDEVVVSRGAVIMTHSIGGNMLRGYPSRFAGVRVGDGCQIGIGAVLFPGVEMGAGSILLSGSSLVTSMPAGRSFAGVPARDLKPAAREPSSEEREEMARRLAREFGRELEQRGFTVQIEDGESVAVTVEVDKARHRLRLLREFPGEHEELAHEEVQVFLAVAEDIWGSIPPEVLAIDLSVPRIRGHGGPLGEAWREFLRKRGVRLHPRTWTYPGGWL